MVTRMCSRRGVSLALALSFLLLTTVATSIHAQQVTYEPSQSVEEAVSFSTEDGWTIHGVLTKPTAPSRDRLVAAVLFLHGSSHDQDLFSRSSYPGFRRLQNRFATLRIDIRGRAKS